MTNTIFRNLMTLTLALPLAACASELANPDAHVERETLLLAPGATFDVPVSDVANRGGLRLRAPGHVIDASIEKEDAFFGPSTKIEITGREVGTTVVELLDGDLVLDTLTVEVASIDHLALSPGQNVLDDIYPNVTGPFGILAQHGVVVQATARTADDRVFDVLGLTDVTLEVGADVVVSEVTRPFFRVEVDAPGSHPVTLVSADGTMWEGALVAVDASAIVALELEMSARDATTVTFSVVGLTADGRRIIGLDPELTVDGVALASSIGRWIFERTGLLAADAVVTATWRGLTATP